jgi:hypothetical protein
MAVWEMWVESQLLLCVFPAHLFAEAQQLDHSVHLFTVVDINQTLCLRAMHLSALHIITATSIHVLSNQ